MTWDVSAGVEPARLTEPAGRLVAGIAAGGVFERIARAASLVAGTPFAAVGLVEEGRLSSVGGVGAPAQVGRGEAFGDLIVTGGAPLIVQDAQTDTRLAGSWLVREFGARFFAGFPLITSAGVVLGALCLGDTAARSLAAAQVSVLGTLADQAMAQLELQQWTEEAYKARDALRGRNEVLAAVLANIDVGVLVCDPNGVVLERNELFPQLMGVPVGEVTGRRAVREGEVAPLRYLEGTPIPEADRPMTRTLREGRVDALEMLTGLGEGERTVRAWGRTLTGGDGHLIGAMITVHDLTADRRRTQQLATDVRHLERLADASRAVLTSIDPGQVTCDAALAMAGGQQVSLAVPDGHGNLTVTATTEEVLRGYSVPLSEPSLLGQVFWDGKPLPFKIAEAIPYGDGLQLLTGKHGPPRAGMYLPLMADEECLGVLLFTTGEADTAPSERVISLVNVLAGELTTALRRQNLSRELATQASTDPLTGLANRREWDWRLTDHLHNGKPPSCLAILDLDLFKGFNDTRGHLAGDQLLVATAAAWRGGIRGSDVLARLGGEEFGLLLGGCPLADAVTTLDGLRQLVPEGQTVSVGVAERRSGESAGSWYARADKALYTAKTSGRNRVCAHEEPILDRRRYQAPAGT